MGKPTSTRDEKAHNARLPVAGVRFQSVDEWKLVVRAAERRGVTVSTYLRTVAIEAANEQPNTRATYRALATARRS
jgi:hypothetical protein